jgi:hypothetical protein
VWANLRCSISVSVSASFACGRVKAGFENGQSYGFGLGFGLEMATKELVYELILEVGADDALLCASFWRLYTGILDKKQKNGAPDTKFLTLIMYFKEWALTSNFAWNPSR